MAEAAIFIFDMDHTLLNNDCDVSWKQFLLDQGLAPADSMRQAERYYEEYTANRLQVEQFMAFQLAEFRGRTPGELAELATRHFQEYGRPNLYQDALVRIEEVKRKGFPVAILTATNAVVAQPLADHLGISALLAVQPRVVDGRFAGDFIPPYSGGAGKVPLAEAFCRDCGGALSDAAYFGDSMADLWILKAVGHPHVVNPGRELQQIAQDRQWPICLWH